MRNLFAVGLRADIRNHIQIENVQSLDEMLSAAARFEATHINGGTKRVAAIDIQATSTTRSDASRLQDIESLLARMSTNPAQYKRAPQSFTDNASQHPPRGRGRGRGRGATRGRFNRRQKQNIPNVKTKGWRCYHCGNIGAALGRDSLAAADISLTQADFSYINCCMEEEEQPALNY